MGIKDDTLLVSVIVPVYNASRTLARCLDSIFYQDCTFQYEVIVINNRSTDNSREIAVRYPVILCDEEKQGASAARNRGIQKASGELLVFIDSDCYAAANWLKEIIDPFFSDKHIALCGGRLLPAPPQNLIEEYSAYRKILSQERVYKNERFSPPFFLTANLAVRKDVVHNIQGFDENLIICEDADFCWRIQQKGKQLFYQKSAVVYHHHRSGFFSFVKQTFYYGYGHTLLFKKYHSQWNRIGIINIRPYISIPVNIIRLPWTLFTGRGKISKIHPVFDIMSSASFISGKIYGSIKNRVIVL